MFSFPIMLIMVGIFSFIQISLWHMFPEKIRNILFANPILAFLINLGGSSFILTFTGVASFVGVCNLGASVVFGLYAWLYTKSRGIAGLEIRWKKFLLLPVIPQLITKYDRSRAWDFKIK